MAIHKSFAALALTLLADVDCGRLGKKGSKSLSSCGTKGATKMSLDHFHHDAKDVNISIVNGHPATECEWRWQVGLRSDETQPPFCGGQLIHPEWVLTAAHCGGAPNFNVVAGEYNTGEPSKNEQSREAVQVIRHPQYEARTTNWDFALVRLASPMIINECVGTVCLPSEGSDVPPGAQCWITGWGTLEAGGQTPDVLQEAEVEILSQQACRKSGYDSASITDAMICAQGKKANGDSVDACQGDSGGPLVCEAEDGQWAVYGATSWGRGCAGEAFPGIWARVHEAVSWIEETLEANSGPPPTKGACPAFARAPFPDNDGDCACPWGMYCSVSGNGERNCPSSGGIGGYGGTYFAAGPSCANCLCYDI